MTASTPASAVWASLVTGGFAGGGIPYIASDNTTTIDIANLFWDATNKRLSVATLGDTTGTDGLNSYGQQDSFQFQSQIPANPWLSTLPAASTVSSARGNANANSALLSADYIGGFFAWGYIPTVPNTPIYYPMAGVWGVVRGVDANGNFGGELHFGTKADSGILTDLMYLDAAGVFRPTLQGGIQLGKASFGFSQLFLDFLASGGVGAQIINKAAGRSGIAAGQTSVVITNNKITANSVVLPVLETADATAKSIIAIPAGGTCTFTLNAAATGQVSFSFAVIGTT